MNATGDFELREVGMAELDAILELTNACDVADTGEVDLLRADVAAALSAEGTRAWSLVDPAGAHQACVWLERMPGRPSQAAEFFVHPVQDPSVAEPLLTRLRAAQREDPDRRKLHVFASANAPAKSAQLQRHGATIVRHFFKMVIPLTAPVEPVSWPQDAQLRDVGDVDDDLQQMHLAISEAFEDHWEHASSEFDTWQARQRKREDYDPSLWWLVQVDREPAAGLIGSARDASGFVGAIGVRRPYRGRGLARRLLLTSFEEFRRREMTTASLFVDSTNPTGAVRLYEAVGMSVAAQWDCHEFAG